MQGPSVHAHVAEMCVALFNDHRRIARIRAGLGLAYLPEDQVQAHIAAGRLVRVLADWCPSFSGYHLYYPSRRQSSPAFAFVVNALRYRK